MKVQERDFYHGAALMQIVESGEFTALNRDRDKFGLYIVNHDRRLLIKHTTRQRTDGRYPFTFTVDDIESLRRQAAAHGERVYVALVCGRKAICCLSVAKLRDVIQLDGDKPQWVTVEIPEHKQFRTRGSLGDGPKIAHVDFPRKVLA